MVPEYALEAVIGVVVFAGLAFREPVVTRVAALQTDPDLPETDAPDPE